MVVFQHLQLNEHKFIRIFKKDLNDTDLVWHFDAKDRIIIPQHHTDWQFQFENQLPFFIKDTFFIPKNTYHRLIKGSQDLILMIKEK